MVSLKIPRLILSRRQNIKVAQLLFLRKKHPCRIMILQLLYYSHSGSFGGAYPVVGAPARSIPTTIIKLLSLVGDFRYFDLHLTITKTFRYLRYIVSTMYSVL